MSLVQVQDQRTITIACDVWVGTTQSTTARIVVSAVNAGCDKGALVSLDRGEALDLADRLSKAAHELAAVDELEAMYDLPSAEER